MAYQAVERIAAGPGFSRGQRIRPPLTLTFVEGFLVKTKCVLFVCSQNRLRSPTAESLLNGYAGIECESAGTNNDAENPLTLELVQWAEIIFVMEKVHRNKLTKKFGPFLKDKRVVCLGIPDNFDFMDPDLVQLLKAKVRRFLPVSHEQR